MKYYKYKDLIKREVVDDNIKMEIPDEIDTARAKIILRRRLRLKFVLCEPKNLGQAESSPAPKGTWRNSASMGQVQLQNSN